MSRTLTSAMETATLAAEVQPALLIDAAFDSGNVRLWSGLGDLTWNGNVYSGVGTFMQFKGFEETVEVRAAGTQISLSGIPTDMLALALDEDYQGRAVDIYLLLFDSDGTIIVDPALLWRGRMDVMEIDEGEETAVITVTVESRLIDLERPRERRYTDQDQKIDYPDDRGFEFVAPIQDKEILWGSG